MLIDDIKSRLNIIALAKSESLQLKKQSNRIYTAVCCFHSEQRASLTFYTDDPANKMPNTFKCYGCGEHGDAINFYAKRHYHSLSDEEANKEAIKQLAGQLGLQTHTRGLKRATGMLPRPHEGTAGDLMATGKQTGLKSVGETPKGRERQINRIQRAPDPIYRALQEFCGELDQETETYLTSESRGLTAETIKKFGIFSIKDYKKTKEFLLSKFSLERLKGVLLLDSRNRFSFTRHKIIIPIIEDGKIIAIRGRFFYKGFTDPDVFKTTFTYGKYQSTGEVWGNQILFNGDILKMLKKGERVYLCEGEFDTMIMTQHGCNAVGVLSVSNYDDETIKRLNDFDLQICFDNDERGKKEADKVARIFNRQTGRIAYFETALKDAGVKDITELFILRAKEKNENIQS